MAPLPLPPADPTLELPPIHLRIHPITDPGAIHFLQTFGPESGEALPAHCRTIIAALYDLPRSADLAAKKKAFFPKIHTVTIFVRPMDGVAYTTSGMIDPAGKEIHCSASYFGQASAHEISGVLIHELVHVWQRDGEGSAPGGFIEGVADYVRWKSGLGAKHWHKEKPGNDQKWDAGYERTGWFLEWVEENAPGGKGRGWLKRVNMRLGTEKWGDWVWKEAGVSGVEELWKAYVQSFDDKEEKKGDGPAPAMPTHAAGQ